jgi:putative spermidine/putrescine transport system ATP-binding protein
MSLGVSIEKLTVELGGTEILHGISLDVAPGEFVTLLGPSGSGKTTTLNAVAGFADPASGEIRLGGNVVNHLPPHRRGLGIVFQSYALFPHMTVGENVGFPLRVRGMGKGERSKAIATALELVQLGGLESRPVRSLSGGQQQRVALARALVFQPGLLLLDEPLAALDKQLRDSMQVELKRIQAEIGVTTIAVTHDQTEALTMSDRIAILREGRIEQVGAPREVYDRPTSGFVARFLGEANLIGTDQAAAFGMIERAGASAGGTAVVRPEHCSLARPEAGGAPAIVENVSYQGPRQRVVVVLEGLPPVHFVVSVPADKRIPVGAGDRVALQAESERVHVIEADAQSPEPQANPGEDPQDAVARA